MLRYCRLTGMLPDGTVFADYQADDNLLQFVVGEGARHTSPDRSRHYEFRCFEP